eukprot:472862-Rhodomonas_salina.4
MSDNNIEYLRGASDCHRNGQTRKKLCTGVWSRINGSKLPSGDTYADILCGIACLATAYSAQGVVEKAFVTACNAMISNDQCLSDVGKRICRES